MFVIRFVEILNRFFSHRFSQLIAFILVAATFAVVSQHQLNAVRHTQARQVAQQGQIKHAQQSQYNLIKGGCVRLNITLADENRSHLDDYDFFSQIYKANADAATTNAAILKKFGIVIPPKVKQDQRGEIARLRSDMMAKTWTPLLNCNSITTAQYKLPRPIQFIKHWPPKSDLVLPPQPPSNPGHRGVNLNPHPRINS